MQKGKHQGGQTQGYPPRNYSTYPGNPENARQYSRGEVPAFHAGGTPGAGPGMRGMHHAPPNQPPTPPTSQDIKQQPAHLSQSHQMAPQSGGPMMPYPMPGTGRGGTQQTPFYNTTRAPPSSQRMAPHARPSVYMSSNGQSFMPQQVMPPVFQGHMLQQMSAQTPMFISTTMSQPFQIQQPRHQSSGGYYPQQLMLPQHAAMFTPYPAHMYYPPQLPAMSRAGAPGPSSQGGVPAQSQPSLTLIAGHGGAMISNPDVSQVKTDRVKKVLPIIHPDDGRNILDELKVNDDTSSRSGESSARQTPQPPVTLVNPVTGRDVINDFKNENSSSKLQGSCERTFPEPNAGQKTDQGVVADFATRVIIAAREDHSGSPSAALQQSSSRISNYSESESQASPDPQGMSTPSVSPSKLDTSVDSISSENQIVENNITYDSNQQTSLIRGGWTPMMTGGPVEILPMSIHPGMVITETCDMMRGGPLPNQPREYQAVQTQWIAEGNPLPIIINKEPSAPIESPVRPTPVVSALAHGPTVEIGPRPQREHFPALGKGHQQQSPVKRKQRSEQTQEQGDGKVKEQQFKAVSQTKQPKSVTPTVESKKQPSQPSQDSEDYVQSVQTKNNEPKTIIIKKNDSDSSGTKNKTNDSLKNKESNNLETRNLNEDIVQDNNNRNKSENAKFDVPVTKENSPTPNLEEPAGKIVAEEAREKAPSVPIPVSEAEAVPAVPEESAPLKANGETTEDDAKSNNQKSKPGNKRPAQSKMRLESKDSRTAEPETPAIEVTPSAPPVPDMKNSASSTAAANEQLEKAQEDTAAKENVDKEKEDLLVATKNEENSKQTTSGKANDATNAPTAPNKVVLKHNYEAGQWSPLNPEGKKKYDRQFIMELQHEPQSLRKPLNLPNLEILNEIAKQRPFDRNAINSMSRSHVDLYPPFVNKNSSQRGGQAITKRGSQQGKPKMAKPTVVQVSLQQDVKLHETENAWKPSRNTENANKSEEEVKTEELYRRVRSILNKLTPDKFEVLVRQVKELPIDNPERLDGVIDLVFKKAVDEPSFSVAYAQMCSVLQRMEVPTDNIRPDGKPEPVNFRNLLIGKCQQEFEKNTAAELKRDERLREIDEEKDPEKKKALQLSFEEEERKIRMRSVGNIRFIGELYKMQMLTCGIMHSCISQLLNQGDEESLECLCKLLTTIGQGLESKEKASKASGEKDKGKAEEKSLNIYFKKLELIVKNKRSGKVSSRVRFMIQDLIDLRNNKWVPRRNESQPKTIDQIQKEAERENIEMLNMALNSHRESNKRQDMRNSLDHRKRGGPDSSGWTTVSQQKSKTYFIEYDKLRIDQSDVEGVSLGNRTQFIWGQGATKGKSDDRRSMSQLGTNKFALLSSSSSAYSSLKGSSEKDRVNSYKSGDDEVVSSRNSSQQDSRSSSRESASSKRDENRFAGSANKGSSTSSQPAASDNKDLEDKGMIMKMAVRILNDYHTSSDVNELEDLSSFASPSSHSFFVTHTILEAMEKFGSNLKNSIGIIMNHYIKGRQLSKENFIAGLSKVLEATDDLALDMPLVWTYIAESLVYMIAEEVLTFKELASAATTIKGTPGSLRFMTELVNLIIRDKGVAWLEQKWWQSQSQLTDFIDERDVRSFIEDNKLEFILIKSELSRMITAKASFDEITGWITENVSEKKSSEPSFVKILMTVLLEACVTKGQSASYKLDTDFLSRYEQLIVRYTNHLEKLELPCLLAIQAFVHKLEFPPTILHNIFNHLWDGGLIAAESFKVWRDLKDPNEQEGHAVCVKSLTSFFTHLNEPETEDES